MKYRKASDILPDELLKEIQKYTSGELLYIPSDHERRKWGSDTGARTYYSQRNEDIRSEYLSGASAEELARKYCLTEETIWKIVYE
jgi:Mor family transcriptional regulator